MKSLYSCSALSLAYPYFCCNSPRSFSLFPSTWVRSSSVSLPHFSLTPPLSSFHFPFRTSSFMFALTSSCSLEQGCPAKIHLPHSQGQVPTVDRCSLKDLLPTQYSQLDQDQPEQHQHFGREAWSHDTGGIGSESVSYTHLTLPTNRE